MKSLKILNYVEDLIIFLMLGVSTFLFVKTTTNIVEFWIWFNLFVTICLVSYKPQKPLLYAIYMYIIEPVKKLNKNCRVMEKTSKELKIKLGINLIMILILVTAGWFVCASVFIINVIITSVLYKEVKNEKN